MPNLIKVMYLNHCMAMGGIETMIVGFVNSLPREKFSPSIAVFEGGGILEEMIKQKLTPVHHLNKKDGIDFKMVFRLRKLIKTEKVNVIHSNNFASWLYGVMATLFINGVKVVHTEHSTVRGHKKRRYVLEKVLAKFTHQVVAVSEKVKSNLVDLCSIPPDKVEVIQNGINVDKFRREESARQQIRNEIGVSCNTVVFGTVGRLVPVKDHKTLIEAYSILVQKVPDSCLLIVGGGPLHQQNEKLVSDLGLSENVMLMGERYDIPAVLSAMDVYVVSSLNEGMSISVLEAMSTSLPIIATNVGGNPEIVHDGKNGLLVASGKPQQLANKMIQYASDIELLAAHGLNSRQFVEETYSDLAMISRYQELYD